MTSRPAYTELAISAARTALTVADLRAWFHHESANRMRHAVLPGTAEYDEIVKACAERKAELERETEATTKLKRAI
jgi:hypothetical protein